MNPQTPDLPPQNFDFITAAPVQKGRMSNLDPKRRILVVVALFAFILLAIIIFFSLIGSGKNDNKDQIQDLAAFQTELIRLSNAGVTNGSSDVRRTAQTSNVTIQSDLNETLALAAEQGVKIEPKKLTVYASAETDSALLAAKQANNYDAVYKTGFDSQLVIYQTKLREVFDAVKSKEIKAAVNTFNTHAEQLKFSYTPEPKTP